MPQPDKERDEEQNRTMQTAIGLGYQFIAATLIFVGGGYYLDAKNGGGHLFTLIGVGLTFLYGGYEVWKLVRRINADNKP